MTFLIDWTIKTSLILAAALLILTLLRRQSAAIRHWVLSAAIWCAAIAPAVPLVMPSWSLRPVMTGVPLLPETYDGLYDGLQLSAARPAESVEDPLPMPAPIRPADPWQLPKWIWLAGLSIGVGALVTGWARPDKMPD